METFSNILLASDWSNDTYGDFLTMSDWSMTLVVSLVLLMIWSLFWKGAALWHAARKKNKIWFVIFLFVNTLGILEIIYLQFVTKEKFKNLYN